MTPRGQDKTPRAHASKGSLHVQEAYRVICQQPGITKRHLAKALGVKYGIDSLLAGLEVAGLLVTEQESKLYPFICSRRK